MKRRILSAVIAAAMCICLAPFSAVEAQAYGREILEAPFPGHDYNLRYEDVGIGVKIMGHTSERNSNNGISENITGHLEIPAEINGLPVVSIAMDAFKRTNVTSVTIPEGVKDIGGFHYCDKLKTVELPSTATTITRWSFEGCTSLESINLPEGIQVIHEGVFKGCKSLPTIKIPESVFWIEQEAFMNCESLTNINIPTSVGHIDNRTFMGCYNLRDVDVKAWLEYGNDVFKDCTSLTNESVTKIGTHFRMYDNCTGLTEVVLTPNYRFVYGRAFENCTNIRSVRLHQNFEGFGTDAFKGCTALTDIYYEGSQSQWDALGVDLAAAGIQNATVHCLDLPKDQTTDVPSDWARNGILFADSRLLVPESFHNRYKEPATRAEFCELAVNLYEKHKGEITGRKTFTDTNDVNVEKMAYVGIVTGINKDIFAPDEKITREQAATMVLRLAMALDAMVDTGLYTAFDDVDQNHWACPAIAGAWMHGLMAGVGNKRFDPKGLFTKEQSILTMTRIENKVYDSYKHIIRFR